MDDGIRGETPVTPANDGRSTAPSAAGGSGGDSPPKIEDLLDGIGTAEFRAVAADLLREHEELLRRLS